MNIYRFILNCGNRHDYLGERMNSNSYEQYYFHVNEDQIMVICPSDELYFCNSDFEDDVRPILIITTAFFIRRSKLKN